MFSRARQGKLCFRRRDSLTVVLCGAAPAVPELMTRSFMVFWCVTSGLKAGGVA
ncbi:MAG: hypothetical protein NT004_15095 [Bacteroidetes bacterium]|nr:hypothetical protein [Bacteroidota bacterium]